ncbi:MAG: TIGR02757 family protein [Chitinophagaceae bacterium]
MDKGISSDTMTIADERALKSFLDEKILLYNRPEFIVGDPICIPHRFQKKQDIEIAGFFAATLAWGNRTSIINSCSRLLTWMDNAPHDFIINHQPENLKVMVGFAHRTFNATDLLYFIDVLQRHYQQHESLETAFFPSGNASQNSVEGGLLHFHNHFFGGEHPQRTRKHVSTPARGSACKRLCMYLRWMVRKDDAGVDFGTWENLNPAQLICPLDVHVARVSSRLGLISKDKADWRNALELTKLLSRWRPEDPAVYDFALFGMGVAGE